MNIRQSDNTPFKTLEGNSFLSDSVSPKFRTMNDQHHPEGHLSLTVPLLNIHGHEFLNFTDTWWFNSFKSFPRDEGKNIIFAISSWDPNALGEQMDTVQSWEYSWELSYLEWSHLEFISWIDAFFDIWERWITGFFLLWCWCII